MTPARVLRKRDAPAYLGMDRNRFDAEVRPHLVEVPLCAAGEAGGVGVLSQAAGRCRADAGPIIVRKRRLGAACASALHRPLRWPVGRPEASVTVRKHFDGSEIMHLASETRPQVRRDRLLRLPEVETATGLKKSSIYSLMRAGEFPRSVKLTARCVAWPESQVLGFIQARIDASLAPWTLTRLPPPTRC